VDDWLAELKAAGKTFSPVSPRGLLAAGTAVSLEQAAKANPRWAEPHVRLAALETNKLVKVSRLKTATTLEPNNSAYGKLWQKRRPPPSSHRCREILDRTHHRIDRRRTRASESAWMPTTPHRIQSLQRSARLTNDG
jgi:hypothetical protein